MDTIFAPATVRGKSGVAIIRVSGPSAFDVGRKIAGSLPEPGLARVRTLRDAAGGMLDTALVVCFNDGASFTGEKIVEFQCHGSIAVVAALLSELGSTPGLRIAEAGEFTRRALENDRLDLVQVEGLSDLIEAETEIQRVQAQKMTKGLLSQKVMSWRSQLIEAMALVESSLDFSDEDVPVDVTPDVIDAIDAVVRSISKVLAGYASGERVRTGFEVAIVGPPNAGKSTLLNAMARRPAALTSEIAGTTRDVIEVRMDVGGLPVTLLDTAGIRESSDPLERAGIALARERSSAADLRVYLTDGSSAEVQDPDDIVVQGKADLTGVGISALTGQGIEELITKIGKTLMRRIPQDLLTIRERHKSCLVSAREALLGSSEQLRSRGDLVFVAEDLRMASGKLEEIVGRIDVEDLLDEIFVRFCIGK